MDDDVQELDASFLGNVTLIGEPVPARDSRDSESSDERDSTESSDDADGFNQALPEEPQIDELDEVRRAFTRKEISRRKKSLSDSSCENYCSPRQILHGCPCRLSLHNLFLPMRKHFV